MIPPNNIADHARCEFLRKLAPSDLIISDWEQNFISGFTGAQWPYQWFTPGRREAVDRMRMKYGSEPEIGMPFLAAVSTPAGVPPADPDGCEYLIREDGLQRRCNEPATQQRLTGFRYCVPHAEQVQASHRRRGAKIILEPYKPGTIPT